MKAAIYTGIRQIEIQEFEPLSPPPGYVRLETKQVGICGSDLHNYYGEWPPNPNFAQGHETCGIVAELGEGVTNFAIGDRVAVECFSHCGHCIYCDTGNYNHCLERKWVSHNQHGGFAQHSTVHASALFKLPDDMSFELGALVEPLAVGVRAVAQGNATYQDRIAIIGGGTIGLMCLAAAKAAGVRETLITVKYPQQRRLAEILGADYIVDVGNENATETVVEWTQGLGAEVVIETVGSAKNFNDSLAMVRKQGKVVLVAGYFEPLTVDLWPIVIREVSVVGSHCYGYSGMETDFQAAIDLIDRGKMDPGAFVTHRYSLDEISEAFAVSADKGSGVIKAHVII